MWVAALFCNDLFTLGRKSCQLGLLDLQLVTELLSLGVAEERCWQWVFQALAKHDVRHVPKNGGASGYSKTAGGPAAPTRSGPTASS